MPSEPTTRAHNPEDETDPELLDPEAALERDVEEVDSQAADPEEVLEVQIEDEGDETSEYYLLRRTAPADEPVATVTAEKAAYAAEKYLSDAIKAQVPFPPWERGKPARPPEPELNLAVTHDGRDFVVGEVDWPDEVEMTHGTLWSTFSEADLEAFEKLWAGLREDPDERGRPP